MTWVATAIAVGGAIIGGVAGSQKDRSSGSNSSGIDLAPESDLEKQGGRLTSEGLSSLEGMVNAGPGQKDVAAAYSQQGALAELLNDFAKSGGAAGQQDILQAQESAKLQFAPQQLAINQAFEQEQIRAKQLAAQLGRPVNDPYIQTQLGKERMNMQAMLGAQQGAYVNQESRGNAMSRLGFTSQLTDVRSNLASQAMANRQALLSLGQGVQQSERNFRLATGTRWGKQEQESGGGTKGMLEGGLMGAGTGMGFSNMLGFGGGAGGGGSTQSVQLQSRQPGGMSFPMQQQQAAPQQALGINPARSGRVFGSNAGMNNYGADQTGTREWGRATANNPAAYNQWNMGGR